MVRPPGGREVGPQRRGTARNGQALAVTRRIRSVLPVFLAAVALGGALTGCEPTRPAPPPDTDNALLLAVGDIASCPATGDTATGTIARLLPGGIAGLGDL